MARSLFWAVWLMMQVSVGLAAEGPSLRPFDICLGTSVCVSGGVSRAELGHRFGLTASRRTAVVDAFTFDCFLLGNRYVLATYSAQGLPSAQPEQLDVALSPQPECKTRAVAERHAEDLLLPVDIGASERALLEKFGKPGQVWTGPNPAHGLSRGERGLVYESTVEKNEFVMIVVKDGLVTRVLGSIAP